MLRSAHDCADGGLGVALGEVAMGGPYQETGFGLQADLRSYAMPLDARDLLFSESHGRAVITSAPDRVAAIVALAGEHGVPVHAVGAVGEPDGIVKINLRDHTIEQPVRALRELYFHALPRRMGD
jgi:phosphoribosylformylglycinamidine synthase